MNPAMPAPASEAAWPPAIDAEQLPLWQQRLSRLLQVLTAFGVGDLRLHVGDRHDAPPILLDREGAPFWNAERAGIAAATLRSTEDRRVDDLFAAAEADPRLDDSGTEWPIRWFLHLADESAASTPQLLELRCRADALLDVLPTLARRLWQAESTPPLLRAETARLSLYRAQALAAANDQELGEVMPPKGPLLSRRAWLLLVFVILGLPWLAALSLPSSVSAIGTVMLTDAPTLTLAQPARMSAWVVAPGQAVAGGQVLAWLENEQAGIDADQAYLRYAASLREQLLLGDAAGHSDLRDRYTDLIAAESARQLPIIASQTGQLLDLAEPGTWLPAGSVPALVMPDQPQYRARIAVDADRVDLLAVGGRGTLRLSDGRELALEIERIGALVSTDNDTHQVSVYARVEGNEGLRPNLPVHASLQGRSMPIFRQLLDRWRRAP